MAEAINLRVKPPCERDDALFVLKQLCAAGHVAYFAGGCVRDTLLGLTPKDWDIATDARPEVVRGLFPNTQAVGAAFGVILVRQRKSVIEIATFRSDGAYLDGRRPSTVRYTTAEEDAQRRDFTINGLFFDPIENKIIDYVGGQADLASKRLRAIGKPHERFEEDHLRLLRAVRFAARFDFTVDPSTADAIKIAAPRLKGISPERIGDEIRMMLTPASRDKAWNLLWDLGLAQEIFRFIPPADSFRFDAANSIFLALPKTPISVGLALAAATLDVSAHSSPDAGSFAKPAIQKSVAAVRKSLKISNDESDEMADTLAGIAPLLSAEMPGVAIMKRFLARITALQSRIVLMALSRNGHFSQRIADLETRFADLEKQDVAPTPFVTGDDLTAVGLNPGPAFKKVLDSVYDAQLEDRITSKAQAMEMALRVYSENE